MKSRPSFRLLLALVAALSAARAPLAAQAAPAVSTSSASLPTKISDAEYWKTINDLAEAGGYFRIPDNFTSNELEVGWLFSRLQETKVNGGVYLGVGPEQNLSYIAAIRPKMAVLFDIRRQAMVQHQLFKAIFELSPDRADFIQMLFAKPRPAKLDSTTEIRAMWDAYWYIPTDTALARRNYARIVDHLTKTHGFAFTEYETQMMRNVYDAFIAWGPTITTNGGPGNTNGRVANTFADMTGYSYDAAGQPRSFMSSEDNYRYVRNLHLNNLILTVTGDFGGPKAIRAVADYLKARNAVVSAFYVSNVEQYLFMDGKQSAFYANVATLPIDDKSVFIRPYSMRNNNRDGYGTTNSLCPIGGFLRAANAGRVYSNNDALACPIL